MCIYTTSFLTKLAIQTTARLCTARSKMVPYCNFNITTITATFPEQMNTTVSICALADTPHYSKTPKMTTR